jgi:hypothetical protein
MNVLFSMRSSVYLTDALQTKTPTVRAQFRRHEFAVASADDWRSPRRVCITAVPSDLK